MKRLDFHNSVLEDLRDKLIRQVETMETSVQDSKEKDKKLRELLLKSFPVIRIKQLRPVVMAVLKNMSFIEDKFLRVLVRDKELYADCDIEIKRHLWRDNQSLFGDEVSPLLSQYIKDKEKVLFSYETGPGFFTGSPKVRRQAEVIQKLAEMIGSNVKLYDMTLQFLRTLFLRTRNVHYCTLRSELLMALHDREVQDVISVDPCHKFTWCLDACIRERNVDVKRSRELQGFLDAIRRGQEQVLGDLSMTLCDPFAINFLSTSAMKLVNHCVSVEGLPRDQPVLHLLLRMLALGLSAWEMIETQDFREPRLELPLILQFLPAMMSLIVDDQVRALNLKLPVEERDTASIVIDHSGPPPDMYDSQVSQSPIAASLAMQYTLQTCKAKDKIGLMRVLGILAQNIRGHPFEDAFLHSLVTGLIGMKDDFETEDFCTAVFDEFFFTCINIDNVVRYLMRLLWWVYPKLPPTRIETLLKVAEPTTGGEAVTAVYDALKARIQDSSRSSTSPVNINSGTEENNAHF